MADTEVIELPKVKEKKENKIEKVENKVEKVKHYVAPKVGLRNKGNFPIHVIFKDFDTLLQPGQNTNKVYIESEIVSVEKMPLNKAILKGLITIIR